jgi:hypothetical protein
VTASHLARENIIFPKEKTERSKTPVQFCFTLKQGQALVSRRQHKANHVAEQMVQNSYRPRFCKFVHRQTLLAF